jgi:hypothetical protein
MAARSIMENNAAQNQTAAGQAATMRAQQQLAAEQALGSNLNNQGGIAAQQIGQVQNQQNMMGSENLTGQQIGQAALANQNTAVVNNNNNMNTTNAGAAETNAKFNTNMVNGLVSGVGSMIPGVGKMLFGGGGGVGGPAGGTPMAGESSFSAAGLASHGALVPGHATVRGDSPVNDTHPYMLSAGEGVLPRTVMSGSAKDAGEKAKHFVMALKEHQKAKSGPEGYAKVLEAHRKLQERVKKLEKRVA